MMAIWEFGNVRLGDLVNEWLLVQSKQITKSLNHPTLIKQG